MDQLDLQVRLAADDRRAMRDAMSELVQANTQTIATMTDMVRGLAKGVTEQSQTFNRYLDMITPTGDTKVRPMTDAIEAQYERSWLKDHAPDAPLFEEITPSASPYAAGVERENELLSSMRDFMSGLTA